MSDGEIENSLKERVHQVWHQHEVHGAVVGISYSGERAIAACGIMNIDNPLPVTQQTRFQIGSITTTFTCLTLLRLMHLMHLPHGIQ